jgi:hypothetical protein
MIEGIIETHIAAVICCSGGSGKRLLKIKTAALPVT